MRDWLHRTLKRLGIILFIAAVIYFLIFALPQNQAKSDIKNQIAQTSKTASELDKTQATIQSLPDIKQITLRQLGSFRSYADTAQHQAKTLTQKQISATTPKSIINLSRNKLVLDTDQTISAVNASGVYINASQDIKNSARLAAYNAKVSKALTNLMEYDPTADFANFDLSSQDTQTRISKADQGLKVTSTQLSDTKKLYRDESINHVILIVNQLDIYINQLKSNGDSNAWVNQVEDTQNKIVQNRSDFWNNKSAQIIKSLTKDQISVQHSQALWQNLANTYSIN